MSIESTRHTTSAAVAATTLSIGDKLSLMNHLFSGPLREGLDPTQVQKCLRLRANMLSNGMWGTGFMAIRGVFGLGAVAGVAYGGVKVATAKSYDKGQWRELAAPFLLSAAVGLLTYLPNLFSGFIKESVQNDMRLFSRDCAGPLPAQFESVAATAEDRSEAQQRVAMPRYGVSAEAVYKAALLKPFKSVGNDMLDAVKDGLAPAAFVVALGLAVAVAVETGNTAPLQRVLAR